MNVEFVSNLINVSMIGVFSLFCDMLNNFCSFFAGFLIVSALIFSIRAMCGQDLEKNCVHGSDSPQSAEREISFFFEEFSSGQFLSPLVNITKYIYLNLPMPLLSKT